MRYQIRQHNAPLRFRRYSRKGYAAFCSLHREVVIGHVVNAIADRQMAKSGRSGEYLSDAVFANFASDDESERESSLTAASSMSMAIAVAVALQTTSLNTCGAGAEANVENNYKQISRGAIHEVGCLSLF